MQNGTFHYSFHGGLEISRRQVRRLRHENVVGTTFVVNSGAQHDIGPKTNFKGVVADTVTLNATDVNDAAGGTGVQLVLLEGLDAAGLEITEEVAPGAVSTQTFLAVNRMTVVALGSNGKQHGYITAQTTTLGDMMNRLDTDTTLGGAANGYNVSSGCYWQVPADCNGYITQWSMGVIEIPTGTFTGYITGALWIKDPDTGIWVGRDVQGCTSFGPNSYKTFDPPLIVKPLSIIKIRARSTVANSGLQGDFSLILEDI